MTIYVVKPIVAIVDVQRIKCMCGEHVCPHCSYRTTGCQAAPAEERRRYCASCGHPLLAKALNAPESP